MAVSTKRSPTSSACQLERSEAGCTGHVWNCGTACRASRGLRRTIGNRMMLPEPLRLLISAYAVGELTPRRRQAAERLLRHSKDARKLLRELRDNRRRLRALPKPELP